MVGLVTIGNGLPPTLAKGSAKPPGGFVKGAELAAGREALKRGTIELAALDRKVDELVFKLARTMPNCLRKTIESVRKHKLAHWDKNRESNRSWLALNMMTEANLGFRAFHEGTKECREPDFVLLRRRLAEGASWDDALVEEILWKAHGKETPVR